METKEIKIKKIIIFAAKLIYNGFMVYWAAMVVIVLASLIENAQAVEQHLLYTVLVIVSIIAMRYPMVSLKYYHFD